MMKIQTGYVFLVTAYFATASSKIEKDNFSIKTSSLLIRIGLMTDVDRSVLAFHRAILGLFPGQQRAANST